MTAVGEHWLELANPKYKRGRSKSATEVNRCALLQKDVRGDSAESIISDAV